MNVVIYNTFMCSSDGPESCLCEPSSLKNTEICLNIKILLTACKDVALNNVGRSTQTESSVAIFKFIQKSFLPSIKLNLLSSNMFLHVRRQSQRVLSLLQPEGVFVSARSSFLQLFQQHMNMTEEPDVAFRGLWRTNRDKYSESTIKKTLTLSILITLNLNLHPGLRH